MPPTGASGSFASPLSGPPDLIETLKDAKPEWETAPGAATDVAA